MTANYMVITVAACEPSYVQEALEHLGPVVRDLKKKAGCVGARYGAIATGMDAGSLALFQSYAGLGDIEKVFDVYSTSSNTLRKYFSFSMRFFGGSISRIPSENRASMKLPGRSIMCSS